MSRLLTDRELGEAVLDVTRRPLTNETGWQRIRTNQDISTLKAVGEWLSNKGRYCETEMNNGRVER